MTWLLKRLKSKTYWYGLFVMVVPYLYDNFALLKDALGDNYQLAFLVLGFVAMVIRESTVKPVGDK